MLAPSRNAIDLNIRGKIRIHRDHGTVNWHRFCKYKLSKKQILGHHASTVAVITLNSLANRKRRSKEIDK